MDQGSRQWAFGNAVGGCQIGADIDFDIRSERNFSLASRIDFDAPDFPLRIEDDRAAVGCELVTRQEITARRPVVLLRIPLHRVGEPAICTGLQVPDAETRLRFIA